ncbi:hypothetical protein [Pedobacter sp. NJ-S-72]
MEIPLPFKTNLVYISFLSHYHGEAGFRAFSHYKGILDKELVEDSDIKFSPHTEEKL